jgi:hypothetical protein
MLGTRAGFSVVGPGRIERPTRGVEVLGALSSVFPPRPKAQRRAGFAVDRAARIPPGHGALPSFVRNGEKVRHATGTIELDGFWEATSGPFMGPNPISGTLVAALQNEAGQRIAL